MLLVLVPLDLEFAAGLLVAAFHIANGFNYVPQPPCGLNSAVDVINEQSDNTAACKLGQMLIP